MVISACELARSTGPLQLPGGRGGPGGGGRKPDRPAAFPGPRQWALPWRNDESGHSRRPDVPMGESLLDALVRWLKKTSNTHSFCSLTFLPVMHTTVQKGCSLLLLQILGGRAVTLTPSLDPRGRPPPSPAFPPAQEGCTSRSRQEWGGGCILAPTFPLGEGSDPAHSSHPLPLSLPVPHCHEPCLPWRGHTSLPSPLPALSWALCRPRKPEVSGRTQQAPPLLDLIPNSSLH